MLFHPLFGKEGVGEILEKWKWSKWIVDLSPMGGVIFFKVDAKILKEVLYG